MYDPNADLVAIQKMIIADAKILGLLDLTGNTPVEIAKRIIRQSRFSDLATSEKRLCIYPLPSRSVRNESLLEEVIEIDCHVPAAESYKAAQVIGRVVDILKVSMISGRYLAFKGLLGELPTMTGFYCMGGKFNYFNPI